MGALFASFTPREKNRWFSYTGLDLALDDHGILPDGVERFLETIERKRQAEIDYE